MLLTIVTEDGELRSMELDEKTEVETLRDLVEIEVRVFIFFCGEAEGMWKGEIACVFDRGRCAFAYVRVTFSWF